MRMDNWRGNEGWSWSPAEKVTKDTSANIKKEKATGRGFPVTNGDGTDNLFRPTDHRLTLPDLGKWRAYWTENGSLDCGGWYLRDVDGFMVQD